MEEETEAQMAQGDKTGILIHYTWSSHSVLACQWSHQNPDLHSELTGSAGQHGHPLGCYLGGSTCSVLLLGSISFIFTVGQINSEGSPVIRYCYISTCQFKWLPVPQYSPNELTEPYTALPALHSSCTPAGLQGCVPFPGGASTQWQLQTGFAAGGNILSEGGRWGLSSLPLHPDEKSAQVWKVSLALWPPAVCRVLKAGSLCILF